MAIRSMKSAKNSVRVRMHGASVVGRRLGSPNWGCPRRDWLLSKWKSRGNALDSTHPIMRWLDDGKEMREIGKEVRASVDRFRQDIGKW